jgi:hypothetical protein
MKRSLFAIGSALALLGLAVPSSAGTITGHVNMSGAFVYDVRGAGTGLAVIDIAPTGGGSGAVVELLGMTGFFGPGCVGTCLGGDGLTFGTFATMLDTTNDPTAAPPATFAPSGVPLAIANYFSAFTDLDAAGLHFDLTSIPNQIGPLCTGSEGVGDSCVEGPFSILGTNEGLRINFDFFGNFVRGADSGFYHGSFASTIGGMSFATLFDRLDNTGLDIGCGVGNTGPCSFDLNLDPAAIPEPASLLTFGAGAAVLAALRRRRSAKAVKA